MAEATPPKRTPPVHSFKTLLTFLDWLHEVGIPNQIDRSFWSQKLAGGTGMQLISGMKYLGLIRNDNAPTDKLGKVVDPGTRKAAIGGILSESYPLDGLRLEGATPGELSSKFKQFQLDATSQRKAITFFIHAARYAEVPLSTVLVRKTKIRQSSNGAKPRKKAAPAAKKATAESNDGVGDPGSKNERTGGSERQVTLTSGGTLKLIVSVDPFMMSFADREFVFGIIDKIRQYEEEQQGR